VLPAGFVAGMPAPAKSVLEYKVIFREFFDAALKFFEHYKLVCVLLRTRERDATTVLSVCYDFLSNAARMLQ
jgi:hypothetical protein